MLLLPSENPCQERKHYFEEVDWNRPRANEKYCSYEGNGFDKLSSTTELRIASKSVPPTLSF